MSDPRPAALPGSPGRTDARSRGITLALGAAVVSGVAVFVNAYGVTHAPSGVVYTTAKNLVAAVLIAVLAVTAGRTRVLDAPRRPARRAEWVALGAIGVLGGGVAFALFFEGLARLAPLSTGDPLRATQAQFLHKTLVIWVALGALVFLRERIGWAVGIAVALVVGGQYLIVGDLGHLTIGNGEVLIALATLIWGAETVTARWLLGSLPPLTLAITRMGVGTVVLVGWLAVTGKLPDLAWDRAWWAWALATGAILATYVVVWLSALRLAPAADVTAVLTGAVVVTYLLDELAAHPISVDRAGLALITAGVALVTVTALTRRPGARTPA